MWCTIILMISVLQESKERIEFKKSGGGGKDLLEKALKMGEDQLEKVAQTSYVMRQAKEMITIEKSPEKRMNLVLLQAGILTNVRRKQRRKAIETVWDRIQAWSAAGQIVMAIRKFGMKV